ncbi:MAG: AraC family transcriptional regulator, partial [Firmicutes bacterium]|nr:AraC family transcriptional regulator [Bacillota bacterium]
MRCLDERLDELQDITPYFIKVMQRIATPDWEMSQAVPDTHSLFFVYGGWMILDANGREYTASRGDLVYFSPGEPRRIKAARHSPFHCYEVDFLYARLEWNDFRWNVTEPPLSLATVTHIDDPSLVSRLLELFSDLVKERQSTRPNRINYCRALFTDILISVLITQGELQVNYDKIRKVERIIKYLIDHYDEAISLKELADLNGISIPSTNKIFKEVTGTTPFDY